MHGEEKEFNSDLDAEFPHQRFKVPTFAPVIPDELLKIWNTIDPVTQHLIKQGSVREQQMSWAMEKLQDGHEKFEFLEMKLASLDKLRRILSAKWSVVILMLSGLLIPSMLVWLGVVLQKWVGTKP